MSEKYSMEHDKWCVVSNVQFHHSQLVAIIARNMFIFKQINEIIASIRIDVLSNGNINESIRRSDCYTTANSNCLMLMRNQTTKWGKKTEEREISRLWNFGSNFRLFKLHCLSLFLPILLLCALDIDLPLPMRSRGEPNWMVGMMAHHNILCSLLLNISIASVCYLQFGLH